MPRFICVLSPAWVIEACASTPIRNGPIIDHFSKAACVPVGRVENVYPPGWLAWDYVVQARCHARIVGLQASTGYTAVGYPPDPVRRVVADFGEKSNPVEVRLDPNACRLYVKTNGSPMFTDRPPMWLLEYDLLGRKEVQSVKGEPEVVPATCARTLVPANKALNARVGRGRPPAR